LAPRIGDHAFIKLFGHGAQERNSKPLLGGGLDTLFKDLTQECAASRTSLRYVSAWEMFGVVESLRKNDDP
jgi:hypothetical protein